MTVTDSASPAVISSEFRVELCLRRVRSLANRSLAAGSVFIVRGGVYLAFFFRGPRVLVRSASRGLGVGVRVFLGIAVCD